MLIIRIRRHLIPNSSVGKESVDFIGSRDEDEQRELIALYLNDSVDFPIANMTRRSRRGGGALGGRGRQLFSSDWQMPPSI